MCSVLGKRSAPRRSAHDRGTTGRSGQARWLSRPSGRARHLGLGGMRLRGQCSRLGTGWIARGLPAWFQRARRGLPAPVLEVQRAGLCSFAEAGDLGVAFAPLKRFLAGDFVRRGCEVCHLFLGNNSFFRRGYLGKQLPQLPHAKKGIISEKLAAKNETASDAFLNLNRPFSAVSKPPPAPVMRPENYIVV